MASFASTVQRKRLASFCGTAMTIAIGFAVLTLCFLVIIVMSASRHGDEGDGLK
jgi:hypothetical protein